MRILLSTLFALAVLTPAHAQTTAPSRGQLLYGNHCVECHTTQMHWREQRLARDFASLKGGAPLPGTGQPGLERR
jgi:mono/diheme cytochrome c family protein